MGHAAGADAACADVPLRVLVRPVRRSGRRQWRRRSGEARLGGAPYERRIFLRAGAVARRQRPEPGGTAARLDGGVRTYSSRVSGSGTLGSRWLADFTDTRLVQEGSNVAWIVDATSKRVFTLVAGHLYEPRGQHAHAAVRLHQLAVRS